MMPHDPTIEALITRLEEQYAAHIEQQIHDLINTDNASPTDDTNHAERVTDR